VGTYSYLFSLAHLFSFAHLQAINIKTIYQLYEVDVLGNLQNSPNTNIDRQIIGNPELKEKLQLLRQALNRMHLPFRDKRQIEEAAAGLLLRGEDNLSRHYRKMNRATKDASLGTAPSYHTRRQDGVFYPTMDPYKTTPTTLKRWAVSCSDFQT
jgi:hypothetical protein